MRTTSRGLEPGSRGPARCPPPAPFPPQDSRSGFPGSLLAELRQGWDFCYSWHTALPGRRAPSLTEIPGIQEYQGQSVPPGASPCLLLALPGPGSAMGLPERQGLWGPVHIGSMAGLLSPWPNGSHSHSHSHGRSWPGWAAPSGWEKPAGSVAVFQARSRPPPALGGESRLRAARASPAKGPQKAKSSTSCGRYTSNASPLPCFSVQIRGGKHVTLLCKHRPLQNFVILQDSDCPHPTPAPLSSLRRPLAAPFCFCVCEPDSPGGCTQAEPYRTCPVVSGLFHVA